MDFYDTLGPLQLKHEFTIVVVGPPKSGGKIPKVSRKYTMDLPSSWKKNSVVCCYREWQPAFKSLQDQVKCIRTFLEYDEKLAADTCISTRHLRIAEKTIASIVEFTSKAHHWNSSIIYIT